MPWVEERVLLLCAQGRWDHVAMRMWWLCSVKAFGMACLAYLVGNIAQVLHAEACTAYQACLSDSHPSEGHILLFSAAVFVLAFGFFLLRASSRKRVWRP